MINPVTTAERPISESALRTLLLQYRKENWNGIQTEADQRRVVDDLLRSDPRLPLRHIEPYFFVSPQSRILDLGSGIGSFVVACREQGMKAFGVEPDRIGMGAKITSLGIARRRLSEPVFASGVGEALPFADAVFDLVVMNQVIEHVADQALVLKETVRVLKRGGAVYVACPNYMRFYEPHYKIFWAPLLPKALGRFYLRLRRRSPALLNQLTYTTNRRLRSLFAALGPDFKVLDLHREDFLTKRSASSFTGASTRLVARLTHLPLLGPVLLRMVLWYASISEGGCEMLIVRTPKAAV
ncbi:MAG TPA: class I SAM-dependent methyltransferase [Candidatus Sulfotelmatobacter sp.]|jgi:SAM-dependent methyltransferase